jgi:hypothetical protein
MLQYSGLHCVKLATRLEHLKKGARCNRTHRLHTRGRTVGHKRVWSWAAKLV